VDVGKKVYSTSELRKGNPAQERKPNKGLNFVTQFSSAYRAGQARKQDVVVWRVGQSQ
jgi:hypothetical protein